MPAIDPARLKSQTRRLSENLGDPAAFIRTLMEILDFYSDLTLRSVQTKPLSTLPTFKTPKPILRNILRELSNLADKCPQESLTLVNPLWSAGFFETRLLAANLLGMIPPAQSFSKLTHLPEWLEQSTDRVIRQTILSNSLSRLRTENQEAFFLLMEDWLKSSRPAWQNWGYQALIPIIEDPGFENLPSVFRIITPAIEMGSPSTQTDLLECLNALGGVSRGEVSLFLVKILGDKANKKTIQLIRRISPGLPENIQKEVRNRIRILEASHI